MGGRNLLKVWPLKEAQIILSKLLHVNKLFFPSKNNFIKFIYKFNHRYVSNSSGKHDFYFSNDKRFIFKTEPRRTLKTFMKILE